ncbi:aroma-sacti cluster domain-containing protein [Phytohabitans rumicis]|uniref:Uncharacterized protein n=1 Tax=Phytohabitans rumicis TaxID=1076125 RepID=A0A6V8KXK4_9ACTN|nr:aroma-sacti cluster domain-containing protein [Phytohabitans rumicis]GFJ87161.1 hypothetical protein Prum_008030 [Phytohabitans rumicis]
MPQSIDRFAAAGIDLADLSADQHAVLSTLSADEVDTLVSIKRRFDNAGGDTEAHSETDPKPGHTGVIFW